MVIIKNGVELSVGKQRKGFLSKRYFIRIDDVTRYYYNEFVFWKRFF